MTARSHVFNAKMTVLATGGYGRAYFSGNPRPIPALATWPAWWRAQGLLCRIWEWLFSSTHRHLQGAGCWDRTEGARGEGGYSDQFRRRAVYEPPTPPTYKTVRPATWSRAGHGTMEIRDGRGVWPGIRTISTCHLNHLPPETLDLRLPGISEKAARICAGVDLDQKSRIPVAADRFHYNMGGYSDELLGEVLNPTAKTPTPVDPG